MIETIILSPNPLLVAGYEPPAAICTGGAVVTIGTKRIHIFTTNDTLVVLKAGLVEYLIVGGGGGGCSGGGGGGGLLAGTMSLTAGNKPIVVGAGGPGAAYANFVTATNGSASSFEGLIAAGGGAAGGGRTDGVNGGCGGGGGSSSAGTTIGGVGSQGGDGGGNAGRIASPYPAGGGGGSTGNGANAPAASTAGNGGPGTTSSISGAAVGYSGGGGGGVFGEGTPGTATHGGGNGADEDNNGTPGTANTGGGGGGCGNTRIGGAGGSGIVIISYDFLIPALVPSEFYHDELSFDEFSDEQYELRDIGGFYSCQFKVVEPTKEWAIEFLNNGVGRMIEFYSEKSNLVWEGFVNTVEMKVGATTIRCSLSNLANETWARYQPLAGGAVTRSAVQQHAASLARWGTKVEVLNSGQVTSIEADQRAQAYLRQYYWATPELEGVRQSQVQPLSITVHGLGYWHTLGWQPYNQTVVTGTTVAPVVVAAIIAACGQFVKSTEYDGNPTQVTQVYDADRRPTDIIGSICDMGDPQYNLFVAGMEADRHFYYRKAAPASRVP